MEEMIFNLADTHLFFNDLEVRLRIPISFDSHSLILAWKKKQLEIKQQNWKVLGQSCTS